LRNGNSRSENENERKHTDEKLKKLYYSCAFDLPFKPSKDVALQAYWWLH